MDWHVFNSLDSGCGGTVGGGLVVNVKKPFWRKSRIST